MKKLIFICLFICTIQLAKCQKSERIQVNIGNNYGWYSEFNSFQKYFTFDCRFFPVDAKYYFDRKQGHAYFAQIRFQQNSVVSHNYRREDRSTKLLGVVDIIDTWSYDIAFGLMIGVNVNNNICFRFEPSAGLSSLKVYKYIWHKAEYQRYPFYLFEKNQTLGFVISFDLYLLIYKHFKIGGGIKYRLYNNENDLFDDRIFSLEYGLGLAF